MNERNAVIHLKQILDRWKGFNKQRKYTCTLMELMGKRFYVDKHHTIDSNVIPDAGKLLHTLRKLEQGKWCKVVTHRAEQGSTEILVYPT